MAVAWLPDGRSGAFDDSSATGQAWLVQPAQGSAIQTEHSSMAFRFSPPALTHERQVAEDRNESDMMLPAANEDRPVSDSRDLGLAVYS
jgi:hypothetical protein